MAKKEDPCGESALWHVGIDEFPMNDENQTAYRVATSELTAAEKAEKFDWWFADRAEADQAKMVLELHGFTVYGPDHVP
ncbi:MAG: hypothetical protein MPW16_07175 [Candidatus Manganitrophus sp.]|nr:MAG: hypothetical protein MPW16_07175 [Candidatus Manganitrophus sp.]